MKQSYFQLKENKLYFKIISFRTSFETFWKEFLNKKDINIEDIEQRDEFYRQFSYAGWAGASGIDCIAIA